MNMKQWFAFAFLAVHGMALAKVLTVDNKPGSVAMFNSAQAAVDAADPGDTILIAGSPEGYGGIRLVKRLNLVGPGWRLRENQISGLNSDAAICTLSYGRDVDGASAGSTFFGLHIDAVYRISPNPIDNLVFERCYFVNVPVFEGQAIARRCLFQTGVRLIKSGSKVENSLIGSADLGLGVTVNNCIFLDANAVSGHEQSSISSSIIYGRTTPDGFRSRFKGSITHCMATAELDGPTFLPEGGGNINGVPAELAFVWTGSFDGKWRLRPNSPARGRGFDGVDMGAFGGAFPYVLSGVPPIPRVTRFVVPSTVTSTSGLRFEVDAQSF